jgi:hypothetical protein
VDAPFVDTNIVGGYAYTVLGWAPDNGKEYILSRSQWGWKEPRLQHGLISCFDQSFWKPIPDDGVFALEMGTFKTFRADFGVAK